MRRFVFAGLMSGAVALAGCHGAPPPLSQASAAPAQQAPAQGPGKAQGPQRRRGQPAVPVRIQEGQLANVSRDQVTVLRGDGSPLQLKVNRRTLAVLNGVEVDLDDLPPGAPVRASYGMVMGEPTALQLVVDTNGFGRGGSGPAGRQGGKQ